MLKELFVPIARAEGDANAVAAAIALARHHDARVVLLVSTRVPAILPGTDGTFPGAAYAQLYRDEVDRAEAVAAGWRVTLDQVGVAAEVRVTCASWRSAADVAALQARYADLAVMGGAGGRSERPAIESLFADLLSASGRPVLVVPPVHTMRLPLRRAVIAWQPTREASRAVHDALPLLREAEAVDVLVVDPQVGETAHGEQPGADIAAHLARHRLNVRVVSAPAVDSVSASILHHAVVVDAQLLVAGGFSHSRLREQILGGVTRDLLANTHLPVLFSH